MRSRLKIILGTLGSWIPHKFLIRLSGQSLILPFYHAVSDDPMPHVDFFYRVRSLKQFRTDLDFMLRHYEPVGLEGLLSHKAGKGSKPAMFLSFDDGLSEIYDLVSPLLISKGIPAALFVNTDFVDNHDLFFRYKASLILNRLETINYSPAVTELLKSRYHLAGSDRQYVRNYLTGISYKNRNNLDEIARLVELDFGSFLKVKKPYMSLQQLKDLEEKGFYIGSHSRDHPPFAEITPQERSEQYLESMNFIRNGLGTDYGIFSFPFSDDGVPADFFREMRAEGMPKLDASFGTAGLKRDPLSYHFQRIQMETGRVPARQYMRGEYLYYLLKSPVGKNRRKRT